MPEPSLPTLTLRERRPDDLPIQWHWEHELPRPEWKLWDAPYYHEPFEPSTLTLADYIQRMTEQGSENLRIIALDDLCIGEISRHQEKPRGGGWWEIGVLIYDPANWGSGYGRQALKLWTEQTFSETNAHVITLTTWSGNERMVRSAQRVGYRECARIPEARLWDGKRWDSVRLAVLRRDWEANNPS